MKPGITREYPAFPNLSWLGMRRFRDCERRWYNAHAVNKIQDGRTERQWSLVSEARIAPWATLTGYAVDKAITEALRGHRDDKPWPNDLSLIAAEHVDGYIEFSRKWAHAVQNRQKWPRSSYQPLDRIVYGDEPKMSELKEIRDRARLCTRRFEEGEVKRFLLDQDPAHFVAPNSDEGIPWTTIKDVPTYTSYDFILRTDDHVTIFDWKTGKVSRIADEKAMRQLHLYALYVMEEWGVSKANISLVPVWLSLSGGMERFRVNQQILDSIVTDLRQIFRVLEGRMKLRAGNISSMESDFPITDDVNECSRCVFRSCEGYKRLQNLKDADDPFFDD